MTQHDIHADDRIITRISEALAADQRTHALDVRITSSEHGLILWGQVPSLERRLAIEEVARELLPPGTPLDFEVTIEVFGEPSDAEWIS